MPSPGTILNQYATPLSTITSSTTTSSDAERGTPCPILKSYFFSWKVLGGIFATLLVVGWVFIIVILIQEEKWQLVLVAWLLLYAAAHFCYWYFKRHHLLSIQSHICGRVRAVGSVSPIEKSPDTPPSYDEIIKSEAPPPEYYSVVMDRPKSSSVKAQTPSKFSKFTLQSLPRVFGRSPSSSSLSSPSCSGQVYSSHSSNGNKQSNSSYKFLATSSGPYNPPPSISASIPDPSLKWKSYRDPPPQYEDTATEADSQSRIINFHSLSPPSRRSSLISTYKHDPRGGESIHTLFSPFYKNNDPNRVRPLTPLESRRNRASAISRRERADNEDGNSVTANSRIPREEGTEDHNSVSK